MTELTELRDLAAARADMASRLRDIEGLTRNHRLRRSDAQRRRSSAKPNLVFNREETERESCSAADEVKAIVIPIQQGERIAKRATA